MIKRRLDAGADRSRRFDAKHETVVNDTLSIQSTQMGVRVDPDPKDNPFNVNELKNEELKDFEPLMRGEKINDGDDPDRI
ncbi:MAG TPA: hypothetical protein VIG80_05845 [Bacillaceae bacterium]